MCEKWSVKLMKITRKMSKIRDSKPNYQDDKMYKKCQDKAEVIYDYVRQRNEMYYD